MKRRWKQLSFLLALAMLLTGIQPYGVQAASRKYVKSLSVSRKSLTLKKGQSKAISYKVRVRGKVSKKISVKRSNANVKVTVKKGKIKITAQKSGNCNLTVSTKAKNRRGRKIKKRIRIKIVSGNTSTGESSDNQMPGSNPVPGGTLPGKTNRPVSTQRPAVVSTAIPIAASTGKPTYSPGIGMDVEVSRSEWIAAVMEITGYQEQEELFDYNTDGTISYSFTDISGRSDAGLMETAVKYGIIPKSGGRFYPDDAADREFLAVTSVRAIGFATDESEITVTDKADLQYAEEDAIAIQIGLLETWNNQFDAGRAITRAEKQNAENVLSEIMSGREIDENHEDVIEYNEDVVVDKDATDYTINEQNGEYTVMLSVGTEFDSVSAGDSIMLPATAEYPEGIALTVDDNTLSPNGNIRMITGKVPDQIADFVDTVDIEGMADPKPEEITAVEGVATVTVTEGEKKSAKRNGIRGKSMEGSVDLKDQTKVTYTIDEIETTVSFYLSELQYKIDFNKKGVKELYIGLPNVFALETDYKASKEFSKKIGDIPIQLHAGFSANIEVYLEAEIGGEISLDFKLSNDIGVQYYNGMFQLKKSCEPGLDVMVDADLDAGAKLQLGLYWMKGIQEIFSKEDPRPIYNIYTKWGLHGDATLHLRNDQYTSYENLVCVDLGYYLYGNVGVGDGSYLGEAFQLKKTWWIFDEKNSPLKKTIHIENGKIIAACTYQIKEQEPDEQEPGEQEPGEQGWKAAYIEFIESCDNGYNEYNGTYGNTYHLININNDDIPELYINFNCTAAGSMLCTYYANQIVTQSMWISGLSYIEGENSFIETGGHMDNYFDKIYCIMEGKFVLLYSGEYGAEDNANVRYDQDGNPIYEYYWNGNQTSSKAEYMNLLGSVYDFSKSIDPFEDAEYDGDIGHEVGDGIYGYEEIEEIIQNY